MKVWNIFPNETFCEIRRSHWAFYKASIMLFTTKERPGDEDCWDCSKCKEHQQTTEKLDLWVLSPVLVAPLKLFLKSIPERQLDTLIYFSHQWLGCIRIPSLFKWDSCFFNSIAVSNCYRRIREVAHTDFAENKDDGKGYHFDDSDVFNAPQDQILSQATNTLSYQRWDPFRGTGFFPLDQETSAVLLMVKDV